MADAPNRRLHGRFKVSIPVMIHAFGSHFKLGPATVTDISMGGVLLSTEVTLMKNVPYTLEFTRDGKPANLTGRVMWVGGKSKARQVGVNFNLTTRQEAALKSIVDASRRSGAEQKGFDVDARNYWA